MKTLAHDTVVSCNTRAEQDALIWAAYERCKAISADLLARLASDTAPLECALDPQQAQQLDIAPCSFDEPGFRLALNDDAMATEKLAEGIRAFCADAVKLEHLLQA